MDPIRSFGLDEITPIQYLVVFIPMLIVYWSGFWRGHVLGRRKENKMWEQTVAPRLQEMKKERDALWRSAVSKTQKLNRIRRWER